MKVFIGYDSRQPVAFNVLAHSIWKRASRLVEIIRLDIRQLPIDRTGLTEFTYARYLAPYLCGFRGQALFLDADMIVLDDICKIFDHVGQSPVSVVKGKELFEWPSLMFFNCEECQILTPEWIDNQNNSPQKWVFENAGEIPKDWNHIVPYDGENPDAKIVHFTQGIPCFTETENCEYSEEWNKEFADMITTCAWGDIMGNSVHKERMAL